MNKEADNHKVFYHSNDFSNDWVSSISVSSCIWLAIKYEWKLTKQLSVMKTTQNKREKQKQERKKQNMKT